MMEFMLLNDVLSTFMLDNLYISQSSLVPPSAFCCCYCKKACWQNPNPFWKKDTSERESQLRHDCLPNSSDSLPSFQTENAILAFGNDTDLKSATNQAPGSNTNTYNQILVTSTETTTTTIGSGMETEQNILRPQMPTQVQAFIPVRLSASMCFRTFWKSYSLCSC